MNLARARIVSMVVIVVVWVLGEIALDRVQTALPDSHFWVRYVGLWSLILVPIVLGILLSVLWGVWPSLRLCDGDAAACAIIARVLYMATFVIPRVIAQGDWDLLPYVLFMYSGIGVVQLVVLLVLLRLLSPWKRRTKTDRGT